MSYISSFTYCDNIQQGMSQPAQEPVYNIVNPLQVLAPIAIPGNFSFSIACNIAGLDTENENCVQLKFISPDNEVIYDTGEIHFKLPNEKNGAKNVGAMQFNLDMRNIVFKKAGLYSTIIIVNDNQIGKYQIQVIKG